jgi:hypothetical protein
MCSARFRLLSYNSARVRSYGLNYLIDFLTIASPIGVLASDTVGGVRLLVSAIVNRKGSALDFEVCYVRG